MTQQHPRQSDDACDGSKGRNSTTLTEQVVESERDARIDASMKRLFSPPSIWPPLFDAMDVDVADAAAGGEERDHINNIESRSEHASMPSAEEHPRHGLWVRRAAIAACLMLGLLGMWMTWQSLPSMLPYSYQPPVTFEVGHLHEQFSAGELAPMNADSMVIDGEGHWRIPETPLTIRLADLARSKTSVEFFGALYSDEVQACSPLLLMRIDGTPITVFADSNRHRYLTAGGCSQSLRMHHRRVGRFDVYELSAHRSPMILSHIECEGPECHDFRYPQCASDFAP